MRITTDRDLFIFEPEIPLDVFNLGKLTEKLGEYSIRWVCEDRNYGLARVAIAKNLILDFLLKKRGIVRK